MRRIFNANEQIFVSAEANVLKWLVHIGGGIRIYEDGRK
jgi:hypothetical protein